MTFINKIIQDSGVQFYNASSVYCIVCQYPKTIEVFFPRFQNNDKNRWRIVIPVSLILFSANSTEKQKDTNSTQGEQSKEH